MWARLRGLTQREKAQDRGSSVAQRVGQGRAAPLFRHHRRQLLAHAGLVGAGVGGVKLNQHLAGFDGVAVLHQHTLDDAGFQRLQGLGGVADDDAALGHGHDVDLADDGPDECRDKHRAHRQRGTPWCGVDGGFLQRCGQEGGFVGQALRAGQFAPRGPGGLKDGAVAGQQFDGGVAL